MKCYYIIFLTLSFGFSLQAQKTWRFSDETFQYILTLKIVMADEGGAVIRSVESIDVFNKTNKTKLQTIRPEEQSIESFLDSSFVFEMEDMNFDGKKDLRLLSGTTTNLQTSYFYWFFDKASGKFVSDTSLRYFVNPSFNPATKTIHTWWRQGFSNFGHALYKWDKNRIALIVEEEEIHMDDNDPNAGTVVTKRNVNGKTIKSTRKAANNVIDYMHNSCKLR